MGTNFSEILIEIIIFSFKKMRLKVSSSKRPPFCLSLNVLKYLDAGGEFPPRVYSDKTWHCLLGHMWLLKCYGLAFVWQQSFINIVLCILIMTSWHGNAFTLLGLCVRNPQCTSGFFSQNVEHWFHLYCCPNKQLNKHWSYGWFANPPMRHHGYVFHYHHGSRTVS